MQQSLHGIHHITAISSDPQANIEFYTKILGLRMVKLTVNYDDPSVYHLYFGDGVGSPGSILTFFPFPDAQLGKVGNGQVSAIGYSIAPASVEFWAERFSRNGIRFNGPFTRFGEEVISFWDNDGLPLELLADANTCGQPWPGTQVPQQHALKRFSSAALSVAKSESTSRLLSEIMGFEIIGTEGNRKRYAAGEGSHRQFVDVVEDPGARRGIPGPGTVHHIAWRCLMPDHDDWRKKVAEGGYQVTDIIDRNYFHSIYYREHAGILFEIATDEPGFAVDQSESELGTKLVLPPWLERKREAIERRLPPVTLNSQTVS
ncbi:MAG: ring-cleaving dioxygenase [Candidatus Zixiibacteriota bacterium]